MGHSSVWRSWVLAVAASISVVLAVSRLVPSTPFLALLAITVTVLIGGPAVWNNLESIHERADRRKREQQERERQERERLELADDQRRRDAEERARREAWRAQFKEIRPPDYAGLGDRSYVYEWPPDWAPRDAVPRACEDSELFWIKDAAHALEEWEVYGHPGTSAPPPSWRFIYETDAERRWRRPLLQMWIGEGGPRRLPLPVKEGYFVGLRPTTPGLRSKDRERCLRCFRFPELSEGGCLRCGQRLDQRETSNEEVVRALKHALATAIPATSD